MSIWLPRGTKYDLKIEYSAGGDAGDFTGGGEKLVWHTTESEWTSVDAMVSVLKSKGAEPHFVIGKRGHDIVVVQLVSLDQAGRALAHPSGPDTNRANCIQVEICGRAAESGDWPVNRYQAFANLVRLINIALPDHREIPRKLARKFSNDRRFGGQEFVDVRGHCGHKHVPGNDHWDPGEFRGGLLMDLLEDFPSGGYPL